MTVEIRDGATAQPADIQASAVVLELTGDWLVRRASTNVDRLLDVPAEMVVGRPLGDFVDPELLHDLRNLVGRSGSGRGVARAYGVSLGRGRTPVDVAAQLATDGWLVETVPSRGRFGRWFGSVGPLFSGLINARSDELLSGAARRLRALTGHEHVLISAGGTRTTSHSGKPLSLPELEAAFPPIIADSDDRGVPLWPATLGRSPIGTALLRAPGPHLTQRLRDAGIRSVLTIRFGDDYFLCASAAPRAPDLELHAAAELFAQMLSLRLRAAD